PPPLTVFDGVSAVVNLGGAGVGDNRWTRRRLQVIRSSRTGPTHALAHELAQLRRRIRYLQGSAVGQFGGTGDELADESDTSGTSTSAGQSGTCRPPPWATTATPATRSPTSTPPAAPPRSRASAAIGNRLRPRPGALGTRPRFCAPE